MLGIYSKIKEKQRKKRILPVSIIGEESRMIVHLKSAMMEEIRNYLELVRDAMMDEVQQAVNNFWAKIRPVLEYQSRSIAALAEALDEMTIKRRRMRRRGVGESTGHPALEGDSADNELLDGQSPPQGGGPIGNGPLANQAPARNARNNANNAGFSNGGCGGYGGEWRGQRRQNMGRGRLNFLVRQLEREVGGRGHAQHPYLPWRQLEWEWAVQRVRA
ncbi:hypothetical protein GPALN_004204 [Globodera pallida]|nr:hypothetical protein GPALN_004204 [Globodera pallida]